MQNPCYVKKSEIKQRSLHVSSSWILHAIAYAVMHSEKNRKEDLNREDMSKGEVKRWVNLKKTKRSLYLEI